jgi:hypothetical protein
MVRDNRWSKKSGKFEPTVAVWSNHHRDFDPLVTQSGDASGPRVALMVGEFLLILYIDHLDTARIEESGRWKTHEPSLAQPLEVSYGYPNSPTADRCSRVGS